MNNTYKVLSLCATFIVALPVYAQQKTQDPNLGHFYMGRQEWSIEDAGPVINDRRGDAQQGGSGGFVGAPPALPKAGWQPYSSTIPGVRNALPKVETGVPKPMPQPKGARAKAGNLRPTASKPVAKPANNKIETYHPYSTSPAPTASGSTSGSSSSSVHGTLLQRLHSKGKSY